ncbi:hypothetical protein KAW64_07310 [bacterium]|nr:hypothetical protein [bacterium]
MRSVQKRALRERRAPRACSAPVRGADVKGEVGDLVGGAPEKPNLGERVVAAIEWVDGTVIDSVRQVLPRE